MVIVLPRHEVQSRTKRSMSSIRRPVPKEMYYLKEVGGWGPNMRTRSLVKRVKWFWLQWHAWPCPSPRVNIAATRDSQVIRCIPVPFGPPSRHARGRRASCCLCSQRSLCFGQHLRDAGKHRRRSVEPSCGSWVGSTCDVVIHTSKFWTCWVFFRHLGIWSETAWHDTYQILIYIKIKIYKV